MTFMFIPTLTLYTSYLYIQVARLFGVGSDKVVLLDNKSKILAKSHSIKELDEWNTGCGKYHDGLELQFRGSKPWHLTMSSLENLKSVTAVLWDALDMDGRFLNNGTLRRDSFDFGEYISVLTMSIGPPAQDQ